MADVFRELIDRLGVRGEFGKLDRAALRRSLRASLGGGEDLLDLTRRPRVDGWFVSVSHTGEVGGWVAARRPIGFDVERLARLRPELIARIATPHEIAAAAPDARWLWPAKEAAFKAADPQPKTFTEITILQWQNETFTTARGQGEIASKNDLVMAVYLEGAVESFVSSP